MGEKVAFMIGSMTWWAGSDRTWGNASRECNEVKTSLPNLPTEPRRGTSQPV